MSAVGRELHELAARLYPICRSITGNGVRETLRLVGARIPLTIHEVASGSRVFDWEVPLEWNIEEAFLTDPEGRRLGDFQAHNLHIVGYSEPVSVCLPLEELAPHLHDLPEHPDWIPYRTSYYQRDWGFCLRHADREQLRPGTYQVRIRSSLAAGSLTYAEAVVAGTRREEVLFFTHVCRPSLANDNVSGIAVATRLAQWIAAERRRYTYRFVFAPATIGSLCWLKHNESHLGRIRHGLVLRQLGDLAPLIYQRSRRESAEIDAAASYVLPGLDPCSRVVPFSPCGYDESQMCSPGFNLPVGRLTRSVNGGYSEYHTSADDLMLIRPECLEQSYEACQRIVTVLEGNGQYINLSPKGEPRLGTRGLYGAVGGRNLEERELALLWVLNQSDGSRSLLDIAARSGVDFHVLREAAAALAEVGLLRPAHAQALPRQKRPLKGRWGRQHSSRSQHEGRGL
jgi:aminopeptidase-like protein